MALASSATVQIAHKYHMIADVYGVTSDVQQYGIQMGLERMLTGLMPALAGADNLSGIGGGWDNAASFEMLVIDDEIYSDIFRATAGIEVNDERLAIDMIDKVGPMGTFLAQPHTMKFLRSGEMRISQLFDKRTGEKVKRDGIRTLQDNAKDIVRKILKEHRPLPLEKDAERELTKVVKEASKSLMRGR
jgi:trimethylamine--corrinoid protein Co-methyltransferase